MFLLSFSLLYTGECRYTDAGLADAMKLIESNESVLTLRIGSVTEASTPAAIMPTLLRNRAACIARLTEDADQTPRKTQEETASAAVL